MKPTQAAMRAAKSCYHDQAEVEQNNLQVRANNPRIRAPEQCERMAAIIDREFGPVVEALRFALRGIEQMGSDWSDEAAKKARQALSALEAK